MIDLSYYIIFALGLYTIGIYCLATKRNMIRLILGIEILINAANVSFVAFGAYALPGFVDPLAHAITIISIGISGSVSAVALILVLDVREIRRLRG